MKIAFYRGTRPGLAGLYNRLVRAWTSSPYSHVELIFTDGLSASSSYADGGVRFKEIEYDLRKWDIFEFPDEYEDDAYAWFKKHEKEGYDLRGNLGFVLRPIGQSKAKWFCSEAIAEALGFDEAWRFDPATLYSVVRNFPQVTPETF